MQVYVNTLSLLPVEMGRLHVDGNKLRDFIRMCRQAPVLKVRERSPPPF